MQIGNMRRRDPMVAAPFGRQIRNRKHRLNYPRIRHRKRIRVKAPQFKCCSATAPDNEIRHRKDQIMRISIRITHKIDSRDSHNRNELGAIMRRNARNKRREDATTNGVAVFVAQPVLARRDTEFCTRKMSFSQSH